MGSFIARLRALVSGERSRLSFSRFASPASPLPLRFSGFSCSRGAARHSLPLDHSFRLTVTKTLPLSPRQIRVLVQVRRVQPPLRPFAVVYPPERDRNANGKRLPDGEPHASKRDRRIGRARRPRSPPRARTARLDPHLHGRPEHLQLRAVHHRPGRGSMSWKLPLFSIAPFSVPMVRPSGASLAFAAAFALSASPLWRYVARATLPSSPSPP